MNTQVLQQEMDRAVDQGIFPGGVFLVAQGDKPVAIITTGRLGHDTQTAPVQEDTVYDLASLTKVLSTTIWL